MAEICDEAFSADVPFYSLQFEQKEEQGEKACIMLRERKEER